MAPPPPPAAGPAAGQRAAVVLLLLVLRHCTRHAGMVQGHIHGPQLRLTASSFSPLAWVQGRRAFGHPTPRTTARGTCSHPTCRPPQARSPNEWGSALPLPPGGTAAAQFGRWRAPMHLPRDEDSRGARLEACPLRPRWRLCESPRPRLGPESVWTAGVCRRRVVRPTGGGTTR